MNALHLHVEEKPVDRAVTCKAHEPVEWLDWASCFDGNEVAVFRFHYGDAPPSPPDWSALLAPDEIARSGRYHRSDDRLRSLYTRSFLRVLAGRYTSQDPLAIRLTRGVRNKPELAESSGWHINATHSGSWILFAIGRRCVGIDVEEVKPDFIFKDIIPVSFSTQEQQYIGTNAGAADRFYELWTRKEAFVKATGIGIDENFSRVPSLPGFHRVETTQWPADGAWETQSFYVSEKYPAAITYQGSPTPLRFYTLDHRILASRDRG